MGNELPRDDAVHDPYLHQQLVVLGVPAAIAASAGGNRTYRAAHEADLDAPQYAASVTKQITAAVAAVAVTEGALTEETSVRALLPRLPTWAAMISLQHLVHHTAGLPSTEELLTLCSEAVADLDNDRVVDALADLDEPPLVPGTAFRYSNVGYVLLAEMLEQATGSSLQHLAAQYLFEPLGLASAQWTPSHSGSTLASTPVPRTMGDGGLWISPRDLRIWLDALNEHRLRPDISDLIDTPGLLSDGSRISYAWGATRRPHTAGARYTHGGDWPGWTAKTLRQPRTGISVALMTHGADAPEVTATVERVADQLLS